MISRNFSIQASVSILTLAMSAFGLSGCSGDVPADAEPAPMVDVPEIPVAVSSGEFCKLFDEIQCSATLGCCDGSAATFASKAECIAASSCEASFGAVLSSALLSNGTTSYSAEGAGHYLRAKAALAQACGAATDASLVETVFVGTLNEGDDCSASSGDAARGYVCKPGLVCDVSEDPITLEDNHTCQPAPELGGRHGDPCDADEDCESNACVSGACDATVSSPFCAAPSDESPPANGPHLNTNTAPQELRITAHSASGSGTGNDITLAYRNDAGTFSCTITETIGAGQARTCVPTKSSDNTDTDFGSDQFYVKYANGDCNDGFRITAVAVKHSGLWTEHTYFTTAVGELHCQGCGDIWNMNDCNSCWIDCDDHGSCREMKTRFGDYDTDAVCI